MANVLLSMTFCTSLPPSDPTVHSNSTSLATAVFHSAKAVSAVEDVVDEGIEVVIMAEISQNWDAKHRATNVFQKFLAFQKTYQVFTQKKQKVYYY